MRKPSPEIEAKRQQLRVLCRMDLHALMGILNFDNPNHRLASPGLHYDLCQYQQTTTFRENIYLVSRGHLKTSFITVAANIQRVLVNPEIRILIASNKAENAEGMLEEIKGHLASPRMIWLFPEILVADPERRATQWSKGAITVRRKGRPKEATIETIGESGEITSRHYDHGTFDDMVGKQNYATRELRESTKKFLRDIRPLFDPGTSTRDYVGTPWHYDDAYAWLLEQRAAGLRALGTFIRPCWVPDEAGTEIPGFGPVRLTYPQKFTFEELLEIRGQGVSEFAAQYLINPLPADTAYYPREAVARHVLSRDDLPPIADLWIVMSVDPAIGTSRWADYSAVVTVGFDRMGVMWVLDVRRGRWTESTTVEQVYDAHARIRARGGHVVAIGVEQIGFAKLYRQQFTIEGEQRGYFLPVVKLDRESNRTKNTRLRGLEPLWHAGDIRFDRSIPQLGEFFEEAERWRPDRENAHDDMLDAMVDTLQLRARPDLQAAVSVYDDPEDTERAAFEAEMMHARAQAGSPALSAMELRNAWSMRRRRVAQEAERVAMMSGAMGEFLG